MTDPPLEKSGPVPLHEQLSAHMRRQMATGAWPPHYKLRPEPDLAAELGVSRGTLRRALQPLLAEGALARVHGKGTFVLAHGLEQPLAHELIGLSEALTRQGMSYSTHVDTARVDDPDPRIRGLLDSGQEKVFVLHRRRRVDGDVVAVLHNYVRCELVPTVVHQDYTTARLFAAIEQDHGTPVATARRTFEAKAADPGLAAQFDVPAGFPVLYLEQISYLGDGRPIEYSDVWIRGDKMKLTALLRA